MDKQVHRKSGALALFMGVAAAELTQKLACDQALIVGETMGHNGGLVDQLGPRFSVNRQQVRGHWEV